MKLHPNHVVPLPPCSLYICLMSFFPCFGKVVLSLIPVVASVCMVSTLCLLASPRSAQESSLGQGSLPRLLCKSSAMSYVFHESMTFLLTALSISLCSWAVGGSILRAGTVHFYVFLSLQCPYLIKSVEPVMQAVKVF